MTKRNGGRVIRVLLAAASTVRRAGLEALVKKVPLLQLAGSLHNALAVAQYAAQLQPDVVLLDLENETPTHESAMFPVVALIDEPSADWTAHALRSGVKAILPRDSGMEDILAAIQAAHAGLILLDADVTQNLASRIPSPSARPAASFGRPHSPRNRSLAHARRGARQPGNGGAPRHLRSHRQVPHQLHPGQTGSGHPH